MRALARQMTHGPTRAPANRVCGLTRAAAVEDRARWWRTIVELDGGPARQHRRAQIWSRGEGRGEKGGAGHTMVCRRVWPGTCGQVKPRTLSGQV
jgi:hypothetical protein